MSEEVFTVELAGRRWDLPHLPFRVIKAIQPALFKVYAEAGQPGSAALSEGQIDNLACATWRAVSFRDPELSFDAFLALPFSVSDLLAALPAVAQAAGLRANLAAAEAPPAVGKPISTS